MRLAKRAAKTKYARVNGGAEEAAALPEREDVSFEDDPTVARADGEELADAGKGGGEGSERRGKPLPYKDEFHGDR